MKIRIVLVLSTLAIGCASRSLSPQPLALDRVECARCRMLISHDRGSAQIVSASAEPRFYDDIGCLAADWAAHHDAARAFVRVGGEWLEADSASFAKPANAHTAMGSGVEAFATSAAAAVADSGGRALTFGDLVHPSNGDPR